MGPGQKNSIVGDSDLPDVSTEEAAAEALNMSFGEGSYARKILESMGWKEVFEFLNSIELPIKLWL